MPNIYKDTNNPAEKAVWSSGNAEEDIVKIKEGLEDIYQKYLKTNEIEHDAPALLYSTLVGFGLNVIDAAELNQLQEDMFGAVLPQQNAQQVPKRVREKLEQVYEQSKIVAVNRFFQVMKEKGATAIFLT